MRDLRGTDLATIALFPGTGDGDRYTRRIRREIGALKRASESIEETIVWNGTARLTDWGQSVADNQRVLIAGLDLLASIGAIEWRDER